MRVTLEDGQVMPGGGAPETELAMQLRDFADSVGGREQLAVEAFADALEVIPRTLAENAGHDPIDSWSISAVSTTAATPKRASTPTTATSSTWSPRASSSRCA